MLYFFAGITHEENNQDMVEGACELMIMAIKVKKEAASFLSQIAESSETAYLILLSLYVAVFAMMEVGWKLSVEKPIDIIRGTMLGLIMWGCALYLIYVIAEWKKLWNRLPVLAVVAIVILGLTFWFSRVMTTNRYGVVFDIYFCLMACGKNYKKILKCSGSVVLAIVIIAALGIPLGYTLDVTKPDNIHPGHSIGIRYPNTWGFLCFFVLMIVWYLYLRRKAILTFVLFWGVAFFMIMVVYARTIAILAVFFPIVACFVDWLEAKADARVKSENSRSLSAILCWIIIAIPFIMFAIMLALSLNYEWVHAHFYYTWFHNMAMRFVVGGLFLRQYGFVWVGNAMRSNSLQFVRVNGEFIEVKILDSSFVAYLIMRGILWVLGVLSWLSIAIWRALKKRDFAIPFLASIILVFAMMERPGLEMWYNFILIYPLAKVANKPGTPQILDFCQVKPIENPAVDELTSEANKDRKQD